MVVYEVEPVGKHEAEAAAGWPVEVVGGEGQDVGTVSWAESVPGGIDAGNFGCVRFCFFFFKILLQGVDDVRTGVAFEGAACQRFVWSWRRTTV